MEVLRNIPPSSLSICVGFSLYFSDLFAVFDALSLIYIKI